jgi:Peptidase C13 family
MYTMVNSKLVKRLFTGVVAPFLLLVCTSIPAAASPKVTVLAFGLFGSQSVFESEAKGAADIVAHQLDANSVVARANTKRRADVTIASIEDTLQSAAERMDREDDILFLILTSHGSQAGVAVQAGRREETLSPAALAGMLGRTGVQHWVVIISACYSGVFVGPLASANTLVITAADSDHSSFGCQDKVKWTYFGEAFFNKALRHTTDLRSAFATARTLIGVRERHDGLVPSNPQIAGGKNIDVMLAERRGAATTGQQPWHPGLK